MALSALDMIVYDFAAERVDICKIDEVGGIQIGGVTNQAYRELILKNTMDMVDFTGNTFLVGIHVENVQDLGGDGNFDVGTDVGISTRDLVATVWHDPLAQKTEILSVFWPELNK